VATTDRSQEAWASRHVEHALGPAAPPAGSAAGCCVPVAAVVIGRCEEQTEPWLSIFLFRPAWLECVWLFRSTVSSAEVPGGQVLPFGSRFPADGKTGTHNLPSSNLYRLHAVKVVALVYPLLQLN
jgi:hypothetical protein